MQSLPIPRAAAISACLAALAACPAPAWGPHPQITGAALKVVGTNTPLAAVLGPERTALTEYCWMPDWRRSWVARKDGPFLADDFLPFPGMPIHAGHMMPGVRDTWAPYFRRALQALRSETPPNAARWVGSLLHFVEDSGAPPHAHPKGGDLHSIMENWVKGGDIAIDGYRPVLLGPTDDEALAGFLRRMESHVAAAAERGREMEPLAAVSNRPAVEAIALLSARESAKAAADVLLTLGHLLPLAPEGRGAAHGVVRFATVAETNRTPAKIMLAGTDWCTLCNAAGEWSLRGVPPGDYEVLAIAPGHATARAKLSVAADRDTPCDIDLPAAAPGGNLLMNPTFDLAWVDGKLPDYWHRQKDAWESEPIPVSAGAKMRLEAAWEAGATGSVVVRWRNTASPSGGQTGFSTPLPAGETACTLDVPPGIRFARVALMTTAQAPRAVCTRIGFSPIP
jgi:hypothetical protein